MRIPSVRHMQDPRSQHQITEAGPPNKRGVLKVVAILEHKPMILKAKLICDTRELVRDTKSREKSHAP